MTQDNVQFTEEEKRLRDEIEKKTGPVMGIEKNEDGLFFKYGDKTEKLD